MLKFRTTARLSLTIGILAGVMVWIAVQLNLVPSPADFQRSHRVAITKSIVASLAPTLKKAHYKKSTLKQRIQTLTETDPQIKCLVIRDRRDKITLSSQPELRESIKLDTAPEDLAAVKIKMGDRDFGRIEIHFHSNQPSGLLSYFAFPYNLFMFTIGSVALITWFLFSKTLKHLNPSNIVPQRVRSAFDTLTEGVALVNQVGEIVHSNQVFQQIAGRDDTALIGTHISNFGWTIEGEDSDPSQSWLDCIANRTPMIGQLVNLSDERGKFKFSVNASPIVSEKDVCRGAIISFDDITDSEAKQAQLSQTIKTIEQQNQQLYFLASYDTLTECFNRGPFLELFNTAWAEEDPEKISLIMVDIDHFKSINDTYGHTAGDLVLKGIGRILKETVGDKGSVCRYGGEEFMILLPNLELENAADVAHDLRRRIEQDPIEGIAVTASVGFSNRVFKAMDTQHLIDQSDQCLYAAKHLGRNRVVRFDQCPEAITSETESTNKLSHDKIQSDIQYSAAMGLLSALSFRCNDTANHSVRVAKLAVKIGGSLLSQSDLYRLEMVALLHNIGNIGVPDAILYKPAPLDEAEWVVMRQHDEIGLQIVRSTFASEEMARILECSQYRFSASQANPQQKLFGRDIPLMSRILYVCDVFDTMVHDRAYRKGIPVLAALEELVNCSPDQFDPDIITILINHIKTHGYDLFNEQTQANLDPRSAALIGGHIEPIYDAIVDGEWESLLQTTQELRSQADCRETRSALIDVGQATKKAGNQTKSEFNDSEVASVPRP